MAPRSSTPETRRAQARYAVSAREHGAEHPETVTAQAEFRSEAYLAAVRAAVDSAPPLSPAQRARLAQILRPVVTVTPGSEVAA